MRRKNYFELFSITIGGVLVVVVKMLPYSLIILLALCLIQPAGASPASVQTKPFRSMDFEDANINSRTLDLKDDGFTYPFIKKGDFVPPAITTFQAFRGSGSIVYEMPPTSGTAADGNTTDKSQHRIVAGNEAHALGFNDKRYWGFAFKLDSSTQVPGIGNDVQLMQWWQGSPFIPPMALVLSNNGKNKFIYKMRYTNDKLGRTPSAGQTMYQGELLQPDQWYTFVVYTELSHINDGQTGEVKLWFNGNLVLDWHGDVGYDPKILGTYGAQTAYANQKFDVFVGPYRPRQLKRLKYYIDEVKYGNTFHDVDPGPVAPLTRLQGKNFKWTGGVR